jgi:hypothetical protein
MVGSTTGKPAGIKMVTRFAYATGGTGILANLFLIAFYALQASHPEDGTSLGSANDLVGSLGAAFMVSVVLGLSAWLPDRRLSRITLVLGLSALAVLTVGGPLLVLGMLAFDIQAPVAVAAWMILCLWLLLVNRWLRLSAAIGARVPRFGEFLGAVAGLGLLLPWMSVPQLVMFGVGGVLGVIGMLGIPIWFVFLGRHLAAS